METDESNKQSLTISKERLELPVSDLWKAYKSASPAAGNRTYPIDPYVQSQTNGCL